MPNKFETLKGHCLGSTYSDRLQLHLTEKWTLINNVIIIMLTMPHVTNDKNPGKFKVFTKKNITLLREP